MRRALAGLVAAVLLLAAGPAPLLAHGRLKSSSPAAGAHLAQVPRALRLDFSEAAELAFTVVQLQTADGRTVPLGPIRHAPDSRRSVVTNVTGTMDAGTYVVIWQVAGDDGHPVRGRFEFVVAPGAMGTPAAPGEMAGMHHDPVSMPEGDGFGAESPLYVVIRWVEFTAILLIVGAVAFRHFVLGRLPFPDATGAAMRPFVSDAERKAAGVGLAATATLAATLLVRLVAQSYAMHGASGTFDMSVVGGMIARTVWGWGWMLQGAGVLLAGAGFRLARSPSRNAPASSAAAPRAAAWLLAASGSVAIALSAALASHASATPKLRALAIVADGVHVLAASSWLGTLAIILLAGLPAARRQHSESRGVVVRTLINAFSPLALASAALAAATGVFAAWLHVGTIPNLWGTRYGVTLLIKLAILGVVALTGFYNWRYVQPRLGADDATPQLQRSARVEVAVGILVLLVTAVLVATPTSMDAAM